MANNFKHVIDRQMWVQVAPAPNAHAAGVSLASDLRNDVSRNPFVTQLVSNTILNRYNIKTKGWNYLQSPALAGTFGAGAGIVFAPSLGLVGTIGSGSTTTTIITSTNITIGANMLANRGGSGDYGFKIRIVGSASGSSGKIEERWIVGNTSAANSTITITLNEALSFSPISGDKYEIIAGRYFLLGAGTLASGSFKSFEVATNTLTTLTQTNLPSTISTDFSALALDEQYVPYNRAPGEGFIIGTGTYDTSGTATSKYCLTATASATGTITGQSSSGDASVLANEYRNFQIRVVEDTAIPTAVGQRRIIASHTAGASPIYTLGSAWSVTPSTTAKFVIEYPNLLWIRSSASTSIFTYNYSGATINNETNSINNDAVSTAYFAASGSAMAAGCTSFPSFGIVTDPGKNSRHSYIYQFRGGGVVTLDLFDIAGGTTGAWTSAITYDGSYTSSAYITTGSCGKYAPSDQEGKFGYMNMYIASALNQIFRFDVKNRVLAPFTPTDTLQAGTAVAGDRLASYVAVDGSDKYTVLLLVSHTSTIAQELIVQL